MRYLNESPDQAAGIRAMQLATRGTPEDNGSSSGPTSYAFCHLASTLLADHRGERP